MHLLGLTEEETKTLCEQDVKACLNEDNNSLWDALTAAFAERYGDAHIEKVGFAKGRSGSDLPSRLQRAANKSQPRMKRWTSPRQTRSVVKVS